MDKSKEIKSGIYIIRNERNQKMYVGSGINLKKRRREHKNDLKANRHSNKHLQNAFNKDGLESFTFNIVEYVLDVNNLIPREQFYMDYYKTATRGIGYNLCPNAGSVLGIKRSEEQCKRIGDLHRGRKHTDEARKRMSESAKRKPPVSEETRKKMSNSRKGKVAFSKITAENVIEIRKLLSIGELTQREIGEIFGIANTTVANIKSGERWSHIK